MADPKNLFSSNKFKFLLTGSRFKDNQFDLTVTGINVPGIQLGTIVHNTSIRPIDRPGDSTTFSDLTIEYLLTENFEEWIVLQEWINSLRDFSQNTFDNTILSEGKLILLTNKFNSNLSLTFENLFPFDVGDIDLSLNVADGEPVRGSVSFKFSEMKVGTSI